MNNKCTVVLKAICTAIILPMIFTACADTGGLLDQIIPAVSEVFDPQSSGASSSSGADKQPDKSSGSSSDSSSKQSSKQGGGILESLFGGNKASSSSSSVPQKTLPQSLSDNYKSAAKKNADAVAWLNVPQTTINSAVMQSFDNNYYLRRNEKREASEFGCYFADFEASLESVKTLSRNTVIYGHSDLKDNQSGQKFSQLFKFLNEDFAKSTPYVYLSLADGVTNWEVFGVIYTDTKFNYIRSNFTSDNDFNTLITEARARSIYNYSTGVTAKDKILTLSTCTRKYGSSDNQRFLIMAKLVDNADKKTSMFSKNPSPKQPQL